MWMFPSILLLYPEYAEILLAYRMAMVDAATDLADETKNEGIRSHLYNFIFSSVY